MPKLRDLFFKHVAQASGAHSAEKYEVNNNSRPRAGYASCIFACPVYIKVIGEYKNYCISLYLW